MKKKVFKKGDIKMKTFNKIVIKVAVISAIICVICFGAVYALDNKNVIKYYIFDEQFDEWTGKTIILSKQWSVDYCQLWPQNEPLTTSGKYWEYSTDFDQWIACF